MARSKAKKGAARAYAESVEPIGFRARRWFLWILLGLFAIALVGKTVQEQVWKTEFLQREGRLRHVHKEELSAQRGMISDRNGEPLAISAPVGSVWVDPRRLPQDHTTLVALGQTLGIGIAELRQMLRGRANRPFLFLKRRVEPEVVDAVESLVRQYKIEGLGTQREYQRYYPHGEVFAHVVGFTDIDDHGRSGLESGLDVQLKGREGNQVVIRDGHRRMIDVEGMEPAVDGQDLALSLDSNLQFLAYSELMRAVGRHQAMAGTVVLLDVQSGEVLAMVNQPSFNPNGDKGQWDERFMNRAFTMQFEPGSTMKPFTVGLGLERGVITPSTLIETAPGSIHIGRHTISDARNYGTIDVATVIRKSSNVGVSRIALELLDREQMWRFYDRLGFGHSTESRFPGELSGGLPHFTEWSRSSQATISYGYGLSATPVQIARAYAALGNDGILPEVTLLKRDGPTPGERVMSVETARTVRLMMEAVVAPGGTAPKAAVHNYRVAGKTGTVEKIVGGGYSNKRHTAFFAGIAPASAPRLAMVVVIDEPKAGGHYGGVVAAPLFSTIMGGALRLLNIAPDALDPTAVRLVGHEGGQ